jgi:hypothetical protein
VTKNDHMNNTAFPLRIGCYLTNYAFKKNIATTFYSNNFIEHFLSLKLGLKVSVEARKPLADRVSLPRWGITTKTNS